MERDQQFLEYIVKELVDHPEEAKITRVIDELGVLLTLSVHPEDMGKIIGRSGATAKAIRILLRVVGMKNDARVNLKIEEPEGEVRAPRGARDAATSTERSAVIDEDPDDIGTLSDMPIRERKQQEAPIRDLDDVLGGIQV